MFELFNAPSTQQTSGRWQLVRLCLDRATQEWLNVGVLLRTSDGKRHVRLLKNTHGLACLYDEDAAQNAQFLLEQASHALEEGLPIANGWHVTLGPEKFIRGESQEALLQDLFTRLVPLARHQRESAERIDREGHQHATQNVRRQVRQLLAHHLQLAKRAVPDFWRNSPVEVTRQGATLRLDVQIDATVHGRQVHGAVASAWYKTQYHRNASLSSVVAAMIAVRQVWPDGAGHLYLLQPPPDAAELGQAEHKRIEEELHTCAWTVQQHGVQVHIAQQEQEMAQEILSDLNCIYEVH